MIVMVDTNVILDALLARAPFDLDALKIYAASETGAIEGAVCATTITTVHYFARKALGQSKAIQQIKKLLALFRIASVTPSVLGTALEQGFPDFEDSVLHASALAIGAQSIVTRNPKDFTAASIPIFEPQQLVAHLKL